MSRLLKTSAFVLLLGGATFAHALTDPAFDRFMSHTVGNRTYVNFGTGGTPLAGLKNASLVKSLEAGGYTVGRNFALSAAGGVGGAVQVAATLPISRAATARMFGVAAKAVGVSMGFPAVLAFAALPHVVDWLTAEGVSANPAGTLELPWLISSQETGYECKVSFGSTQYGPAPTCSAAMAMAVEAVNKFVSVKITDSTCARTPTNMTAPCQYFNGSWRPAYTDIKILSPITAQREASTDEVVGLLTASTQWPEPDLIKSMIEAGAVLNPDPGVMPSVSIVGDTRGTPYNVVEAVKVGPDGITTATSDCVRDYISYQNYIDALEECKTTTVKPDGTSTTETTKKPATDVTTAPANQNPASAPAPATTPASAPVVETCGLPGKPACIISEVGMPDQAAIDAKMDKEKAASSYKDIADMAVDPTAKLPVHPVVNWSFTLPSGCAVLPLPAFEPFIMPIDICEFKPMFHDIMSIVWIFGGIFGAISLFMKNALSH